MQVRAIKAGFYNDRRYRAGDTFEFKGEKLGSWMVAVEGDAQAEPEAKTESKPAKGKKSSGPQTFSDIAKQDAAALTPKGADDLV